MLNHNENVLIKIETKNDNQIVDARELHTFLEVGRDYTSWIKGRIKEYGFVENEDFEVFTKTGENLSGGRPSKEYAIKLDMGKELAMVERSEKGRVIRKHFIAVEKEFRKLEWHGLPTIVIKGKVYVNYKPALRVVGFSARSGAVYLRKKRHPHLFTLMYGHNWITVDYADLLIEQMKVRQMSLKFEETKQRVLNAKGGEYDN